MQPLKLQVIKNSVLSVLKKGKMESPAVENVKYSMVYIYVNRKEYKHLILYYSSNLC